MRALLVVVALLAPVRAFAVEPLTVEGAVALALERNVEVAARTADLSAARARLTGARAPFHANPEVGVQAGPRVRGDEVSTDVFVELTQRLELFGTRGSRIESAEGSALAAEAALAARRTDVAAQARIAFARAVAAERLASIAEDELALARESARIAARRSEVGDGTRLEVSAAQVEVGLALREVSVSRNRLEATRAELRLVAGLSPGDPLPLAGETNRARAPMLRDPDTVERAVAGRWDVAALRHELDAARAEEQFTAREWLPQPRVGAIFAREEGANIFLGTVSFELPLWNQNVAGRGVASARVARAGKELEASERRARQEALLAASRLERAREAARAFDADVVNAAKESVTLTTRAYEAGKIRLVDLLLMRRSALEAWRGEAEALAELAEAEAELLRALGREQPEGA